MRVFISWSGDASQKVAEQLRDWIPSVLQNVKAYFTPSDLEKGARWSTEIFGELEASAYGIVVLTKDNLERPWILFESGALIAKLGAKVCPLLIGVTPADVKGPLSHFQGTSFQRADFKKLMGDINRDLDAHGVTSEVFERIFEKWWPDLEAAVEKVLTTAPPTKAKGRTDRDILEEVLVNVRNLQRERVEPRPPNPSLSRRFLNAYNKAIQAIPFDADKDSILKTLSQITDEFRDIVIRNYSQAAQRESLIELEKTTSAIDSASDEIPF